MTLDRPAVTPEAMEYARHLIDEVAALHLPELFSWQHPEALYYLPNRHGVSVVVVRTPSLTAEQLSALLKYPIAQYLQIGYVDPQALYEASLNTDLFSTAHPSDIHYIAGSARSGQILCYMTIKAADEAPPGTTLHTLERPLFPTEQYYGWGVFNRLLILPDLPFASIREFGRFVKNYELSPLDDLGTRAPVELFVAVSHTVPDQLHAEIQAFVGDIEETVTKRNLDFFEVPTVMIHGAFAYLPKDNSLLPRFRDTTPYPFAILVSDLHRAATTRVPSVERALEQPGKQGLLALLALKRTAKPTKSSLEPEGGLAPLVNVKLPQVAAPMPIRRQLLDQGARLREFDLFSGLTPSEATALRSFMQPAEAAQGEAIVRQGEYGDSLYLIEEGEVAVHATNREGEHIALATLGPGEFFGEIGLLSGGTRTAYVMALTPVKLLEMTREIYERYLHQMAEIEGRLAVTATKRAADTLRRAGWS